MNQSAIMEKKAPRGMAPELPVRCMTTFRAVSVSSAVPGK